jgi:hypothetical protein
MRKKPMTTITHFPPIPTVLTPPQVTAIFTNKTASAIQVVTSAELFVVLQPGQNAEFGLSLDELTSGIAIDIVAPPGTVASPDGTSLTPPDGTVIFAANAAWSFGPKLAGGSNAVVLLNGQPATPGVLWAGTLLEVNHGGTLYLQYGSTWRAWNGSTFAPTPAP